MSSDPEGEPLAGVFYLPMRVTRELVEQVLRSVGTQTEIGKATGLSHGTINAICQGKYNRLLDEQEKPKRLYGKRWCPKCTAHVIGQCPVHATVEMQPAKKYAEQLKSPYGAAFGRTLLGFCGRVIRKKVTT